MGVVGLDHQLEGIVDHFFEQIAILELLFVKKSLRLLHILDLQDHGLQVRLNLVIELERTQFGLK